MALQSNLPDGGSIVYGIDDAGVVVGLAAEIPRDDVARVIADRTMCLPPGVSISLVEIENPKGAIVKVLWVVIPPNRYAEPTSFLDTTGVWKAPIRVDTVTKYLSPHEAIALYKGRGGDIRPAVGAPPKPDYGSEPDKTEETLEANLFPFTQLPKFLWAGQTDATTDEEIKYRCQLDFFPFRLWNGQIVSVRPKDQCERVFEQALQREGKNIPLSAWLRRGDERRVVKSLLNKEIVAHALERGLRWDEETNRVFFTPENGRVRKLSWQSFSRPATRVVVGARTMPDGSIRHWYHFAARLRVEDFGDMFTLLIEPTWVFTRDGREILRSFWVAPLATRRMNLEDNARVLYNIRCWQQVLGGLAKGIELPLAGGCTIAGQPATVEMESGILGDKIAVPEIDDPDSEVPEVIPLVEPDEEEDEDT